ncbi:MAG: hypothetical protein OEZ39_01645 [Gammaproteobacteria bacterium]|nr:hypothetical protein [Gammaproteobacteria bacterium]MDH5650556.1 hypothetical protein [Gammaproteobacteria bacterium]
MKNLIKFSLIISVLCHATYSYGASTQARVNKTHDRLVISLPGAGNPSGSVTSHVKVDTSTLENFCGDDDGCQVQIAATGILKTRTGTVILAPWSGGTCHLFVKRVDNTLHWTVAQDCVHTYMLKNDAKGFQRYNTHSYGIDGDGIIKGNNVMGYAAGCFLTTSPPNLSSNKGELLADTEIGFHFINSGKDWLPSSRYWSSAVHDCKLIINN